MNSIEEITDTLGGHFEALKYHPLFTLWGISYYWDIVTSSFMNEPRQTTLVGNVLAKARSLGHHIVKPRIYVPKARDEFVNQSLLCIRNLDSVAEAFAAMTGRYDLEERVNDAQLLREAAGAYIAEAGKLPETVDFFDFLAHYRQGEDFKSDGVPSGQYVPLLERLMIRFELSENVMLDIKRVVGDELYSALHQQHAKALEARKPKVSDDLRKVYRQYADSKDDGSYMPTPKLSPKRCFGKRRVRVGCGSDGGYIDLEQLAQSLRHRGQVNLDPSALLRQKVLNRLLDYYTPLYRDDPQGVLDGLQERIRTTTNPEEVYALRGVHSILEKAMLYKQSNMINHTMVVSSRRR